MPGNQQIDNTHASPSIKPPRFGFIDLLRGFALVVMIETHVVNSYLPIVLRKGSLFYFCLTFLNGLVAPSFLFASGFSIILQSNHQWDNWLNFRLPFWRQMRRLGFICLVGYYSHLQGFKLSRYFREDGPSLWPKTLQVDILQCIVISLLVVHALIFILRKKKLFPWGAGLLAALVALATPWMWAQDFRSKLPLAIALFLNPHGISLFPIFPWICFVLAGSCAAHFFLQFEKARQTPRYIGTITILGILMIACGLLLRLAPFTLPGFENFYTTSPLYVILRIGCVLLICALLYKLESGWQWSPKPIQLAGQESLLVYGAHLGVIFAFLRGKHMAQILGLQAGYVRCFLLSALIALIMLFLAKQWHALKKCYPRFTRFAQALAVTIMIAVFLLS